MRFSMRSAMGQVTTREARWVRLLEACPPRTRSILARYDRSESRRSLVEWQPVARGRRVQFGSSISTAEAATDNKIEVLRKLRDGQISREEYFDAVVERGLTRVRARMSTEQLELVRRSMRKEIESSPVLLRMIQDALDGLPDRVVH